MYQLPVHQLAILHIIKLIPHLQMPLQPHQAIITCNLQHLNEVLTAFYAHYTPSLNAINSPQS